MNEAVEIRVLKEFSTILDALDIMYAIGGSIASSVYGQVRFTQDADVMVEAFSSKASAFYEKVKALFYISQEAMQHALQSGTSFNIIHLETAFKIDIFISTASPFDCQVLSRAGKIQLGQTEKETFRFVSSEDIILLKMLWYEKGQRVSEKQWNDILGVITTQKQKLNVDYLNEWATRLSVRQLLEKALIQSEL